MRESPRTRRLRSDRKALDQLKADSTIFDFQAYGDPPHTYIVRFFGKGLKRTHPEARVELHHQHEVRIELGASYPRLQPELAWRTPIFHPNISAGGVVCLGGYGTHWVPSLNLDELCEMLWDMIRYANFDVNSPYNRDAATWAKLRREHQFPVDPRPIRDRLAAPQADAAEIPVAVPVIETPPHSAAPAAGVPHVAPVAPPTPRISPVAEDILFIDDEVIVNAEVVDDEPDILIIE